MKKRNYLLPAVCCALLSLSFISCSSDDDDPIIDPLPATEGLYVLNSGKMNSNNASLSFYNLEDKKVETDVFMARNGRGLGDTAQDLLIYGSKMYISVYNSSTIEVTDLEGKSIKQIKTNQPRSLASHNGKVYVTLYTGHVARLDTISLEIDNTIQVGRNPEQLVVANNKLYVANSGGLDYNTQVGYDKTVSVVNLTSFMETKKIEVVLNPNNLVTDNQEDVYLVSWGNYGDVPNTLQRIDTKTDEVSAVEITNATEMASTGENIYMYYSQYDANWNQTISFYVYDAINEKVVTDQFIKDGTTIAKPYRIQASADLGYVFITESDYTNNGDVYIFTEQGTLVDKTEVGLNPIKVATVKY